MESLGYESDDISIRMRTVQLSNDSAAVMCFESITSYMMHYHSVDSLDGLRALLPALRQELKTPAFSSIYNFAFDFNKNPGQKNLG